MDLIGLYPKNHFGSLTADFLREIKLGDSCLLYGVSGTGKNYFLQFLSRQIRNGIVISLEAALLGSDPVAAISSEILSHTLEKRDLNSALKEFTATRKLVICISSIQDLSEVAATLQFLDSIRRVNLQNIVIIGVINQTLFTTQKENIEYYGNFFHSRYLMPLFDLQGIERSIKINNIYYGWKTPLNLAPRILELSGGVIRLAKYITKAVVDDGEGILDDLSRLSQNQSLKPRLNLLLDAALKCNAGDLRALGLTDDNGKLTSELLNWQFRNYQNPILAGIFPVLTDREQQLISYFLVNKNMLVPRERMEMFLNFTDANWSMWANYKAINRLQKKIAEKYILKNIKGKGYILMDNQK